jgi:hypothetical protein
MKSPGIGVEPVPRQAQKTAPQGSISAFRATEDPPPGLLQLLFIQSQKVNSANFALSEFSEVQHSPVPLPGALGTGRGVL